MSSEVEKKREPSHYKYMVQSRRPGFTSKAAPRDGIVDDANTIVAEPNHEPSPPVSLRGRGGHASSVRSRGGPTASVRSRGGPTASVRSRGGPMSRAEARIGGSSRGRGANAMPVSNSKTAGLCYNCGMDGHNSNDCPDPRKERLFGPKKERHPPGHCYNCGKEDAGHLAKDCPEPKKERQPPPGRCYNCGKDDAGHWAKDCPQPKKERRDRDGKPMNRLHVPTMRGIEQLFAEDVLNEELYRTVVDGDEECTVVGSDDPVMLDTWTDANFEEPLMVNIEKARYHRPRKIQAYVIPYIIMDMDVLGHAETGSGKTAAFLLPIINNIILEKSSDSPTPGCAPYALIVVPTRELCMQVCEQAMKLSDQTGVKVCKTYGLYCVSKNINELQAGCDILVGTPGRLRDFFDKQIISPSKLKYLVFDEADRLFEEGFMTDLDKVIEREDFPKKDDRHTYMFSATLPPAIQKDATVVLRDDYVTISNQKFVAVNNRVKQTFFEAKAEEKNNLLLKILTDELEEARIKDPENPLIRRTLVFVEKRAQTKPLAQFLSENGIPALVINGDMEQYMREQTLNEFRDYRTPVLVSTDIFARGIDIKGLDHVINLDLPYDAETYVHRVGRTGRLCDGQATSFVDVNRKQDKNVVHAIWPWLKANNVEPPEFMTYMVKRGQYREGMNRGWYEIKALKSQDAKHNEVLKEIEELEEKRKEEKSANVDEMQKLSIDDLSMENEEQPVESLEPNEE